MCGGIRLRETTEVCELRRGKGGGCSRLEGTAKEQLRGKKRGEVHIEGTGGGGHIGGSVAWRGGGIDSRDIDATRIAVRKILKLNSVIGTVCLVGETRVVCV